MIIPLGHAGGLQQQRYQPGGLSRRPDRPHQQSSGQSHRRTSPLEPAPPIRLQTGGLTLAAITRVYILPLAAEMLGVDVDLLWEVHVDNEPEDGCPWVYGPDD